IIGSGDVLTAEDAVRMKLDTGVDIVWVARGAIGNPWIFQHAKVLLDQTTHAALQGEVRLAYPIQPPTIFEQRQALSEHFAEAMNVHGEQTAGRRMRKLGIKYARFHPQAAEVKKDFIDIASITDWSRVLERWYPTDGPGIWPAPASADEVNDPQSCEM
ncbi:MAG: tRNA-dihydrouridine synthase, partial [Tepidisphaeraceae bacterium]